LLSKSFPPCAWYIAQIMKKPKPLLRQLSHLRSC
jgi:hypothetical protein